MNEKGNQTKPNFDEACRFIIKLGERMHGYGPNAARLEYYLNRITKILGYQGVFRSTPDQISFAFSKDGSDWQKIHISTMHGTGTELNRLAKVGELIDDLGSGKLSVAEASTRLDEIDKTPHPWGNATTALSYVLTGVAFPVLLGGSWMDLIFSGILSLVVFFMVMKSGSWRPLEGRMASSIHGFCCRYSGRNFKVFHPRTQCGFGNTFCRFDFDSRISDKCGCCRDC